MRNYKIYRSEGILNLMLTIDLFYLQVTPKLYCQLLLIQFFIKFKNN